MAKNRIDKGSNREVPKCSLKRGDLERRNSGKEAIMYCSSCGTAISQGLKYCNRCGVQLITTKETASVDAAEKRLYEEGVDLFWVTVIGLGLILGGVVAMKALQLSEWIIIAYMILSSTAFTINIALSLWQIRRLAKISKEARASEIDKQPLNELSPIESRPVLEPLTSVTEHTTRGLAPVSKDKNLLGDQSQTSTPQFHEDWGKVER